MLSINAMTSYHLLLLSLFIGLSGLGIQALYIGLTKGQRQRVFFGTFCLLAGLNGFLEYMEAEKFLRLVVSFPGVMSLIFALVFRDDNTEKDCPSKEN